jgi:D-amino-acid dehydrogenase
MLLVYRRRRGLEQGLRAREALAAAGERYRRLTPEELVALDGGYAAAAPWLAGAILAESCGHADCGAFTRALAQRCAEQGVVFSLGRAVRRLEASGGKIFAAHTDAGPVTADVYVLAAGAWSAPLARSAGVRLPIVPVKGYAVTVPIAAERLVPDVGGVDEDAHVAFSRMGRRLRMSSTAELCGYDDGVASGDVAAIRRTADALFPAALDWSAARLHSGLRPATPAGRPLIGPATENLFVNSGHGHLGWTQACGSARLLADLVERRTPALDPTPYLP